jgi:FkbH-like protein
MRAPQAIKELLTDKQPAFWPALKAATQTAQSFEDLFLLCRMRLKALKEGVPGRLPSSARVRLALLGGYTTTPLKDLLVHLMDVAGLECEVFAGEYDNYNAEILDDGSPLWVFAPTVAVVIPAARRCVYQGSLNDPLSAQRSQVEQQVQGLLALCNRLNERTGADVILCNFAPQSHFDPGPYRARSLTSDWTFQRAVNLELGLAAGPHVHVCDLEFLAARRGLVRSRDEKAWFESKQLGSPDFMVDVAREMSHMVAALRTSIKKVLVMDLDNTLWGGVIGDDGLNGIEVGDTTPRGEAFKAFQRCALSLSRRGVLLAVCSKNQEATAKEVFEKHPEMVLRLEHFAAFKANWNPKSDNIRAMAEELSLGLDSFVFVDDNPAEVEIVKQFCPGVATIHLGPDPADYCSQLLDARLFEPVTITSEDLERVQQYRVEAQRRVLLESSTDMGSYLRSLEMVARVDPLDESDLPRAAQLVNKSNQFNLTTIRRSEAEIRSLIADSSHDAFTVRLADKFGDHGLISVVFTRQVENALHVETWVMSCRVLKRQVEDLVVNEVARIARRRACNTVLGLYWPTAKNTMVRDLYVALGFERLESTEDTATFALSLAASHDRPHSIEIKRREN